MSVEAVLPDPTRKRPALKNPQTRWRTATQERIYGQKLLDAIKSTGNSPRPPKLSPSRAIKEAADSALALAAKGQTRWSRAILFRRCRNRKLSIKAGGRIRRCKSDPVRTPLKKTKKKAAAAAAAAEEGEEVGKRLRVLSRLVPGARKLSTPTLLEEAADYVAALELQVKAMRALADLLSSMSLSSPPPPPSDETDES